MSHMQSGTMTGVISFSALSADISPQRPLALAGYAERRSPFESVDLPLEINALRADDGVNELFLLSVDALFAGTIAADVEKMLGVDKSLTILAFASHTHYAPALDAKKPQLGAFDAEYYQRVLRAAEALILDLRRNPRPGMLTRGHSDKASFMAINRRDRRWSLLKSTPFVRKMTVMAPNYRSPGRYPIIVHLISTARSDGSSLPLALIWHWTCHPVAAVAANRVSAAFPGHVRKILRQQLRTDLPVLFLQGFCGDVRPNLGVVAPGLKQALTAFPGPVFGGFSNTEYQKWLDVIAAGVLEATPPCGLFSPEKGKLRFDRADIPISNIMDQAVPEKNVSFGRLDIGPTLRLAMVSAEALNCHEKMVFDAFGKDVLPVGYWDDCFGYLPCDTQLSEGGYEAEGFAPYFSLDGKFKPVIDAQTSAAWAKLA